MDQKSITYSLGLKQNHKYLLFLKKKQDNQHMKMLQYMKVGSYPTKKDRLQHQLSLNILLFVSYQSILVKKYFVVNPACVPIFQGILFEDHPLQYITHYFKVIFRMYVFMNCFN